MIRFLTKYECDRNLFHPPPHRRYDSLDGGLSGIWGGIRTPEGCALGWILPKRDGVCFFKNKSLIGGQAKSWERGNQRGGSQGTQK